jgi:dephospho-CoA kinase
VHVFGLTGGIASGKSAVASRFRARGLPVVDADLIARQVVDLGTPGLAEVAQAFGPGILAADGTLDRKALAARIFESPMERRRLNGILHPRIAIATQEALDVLRSGGMDLACYEAALLVENGLTDAFRPLVVVAVSESTQIARLCTRDSITEAEARARLAAQMPLAEKLAKADLVIANDGDQAALLAATDAALNAVCTRLGIATRPPAQPPAP